MFVKSYLMILSRLLTDFGNCFFPCFTRDLVHKLTAAPNGYTLSVFLAHLIFQIRCAIAVKS